MGGLSARTLNAPRGVLTVGSKLVVGGSRQQPRAHLGTSSPTGPGTPANVVIGQRDFVTSYTRPARDLDRKSARRPSIKAACMLHSAQSRILYWNTLPSTNGEPADGVLGQTDFVTTAPNSPLLPPIETLCSNPDRRLWPSAFVADQTRYNRVVVRPLPN